MGVDYLTTGTTAPSTRDRHRGELIDIHQAKVISASRNPIGSSRTPSTVAMRLRPRLLSPLSGQRRSRSSLMLQGAIASTKIFMVPLARRQRPSKASSDEAPSSTFRPRASIRIRCRHLHIDRRAPNRYASGPSSWRSHALVQVRALLDHDRRRRRRAPPRPFCWRRYRPKAHGACSH